MTKREKKIRNTQRQSHPFYPLAKQPEIIFKLADCSDSPVDLLCVMVPKPSRVRGQLAGTAFEEIAPASAGPGAQQFQHFTPGQFPKSGHPQFQTGQLGRVRIQRDHGFRIAGQQGQCIVTRRGDRQTDAVRFDAQCL